MRRGFFVGFSLLPVLVLALVFGWGDGVSARVASPQANQVSDLLIEYPAGGAPFRVTTGAPGHVWFTLPDENAIGSLVVTSTLDYKLTTYPLPSPNSKPYDLVFVEDGGAGSIWVTEMDGNRLAELDVASGAITEYDIPTPDSRPAGLDVASDGSVWFAERAGDKLGRFQPAGGTFSEYPMDNGAEPEAVDAGLGNIIWVTAPGVDQLLGFRPASSSYISIPAGASSSPTAVVTDQDGQPWISAPGLKKIGTYLYGTLSIWLWFEQDRAEFGVVDMALTQEANRRLIWYVDRINGQVGHLDIGISSTVYRTLQLPAPNSRPTGITVDENGNGWIADNGRHVISLWLPPYFYDSYLPMVAGP